MSAVANVLTSFAMASSMTGNVAWPYVTLPSVELRRHFENVKTLTQTNVVWIAPLVANVAPWEVFAFNSSTNGNVPMSDTIFAYTDAGVKMPAPKNGVYAPIHQIYPSPPPVIPSINGSMANYDTRSDPTALKAFAIVDATKASIISDLLPMKIVRDAYPDAYAAEEPLSLMIQPVFRSFEDNTIVSYVQSVIEWRHILSNMLTEDHSLYCYVENTCGSNFTIKVVAGEATYEGTGDQHPKQYDSHAVSTTVRLAENAENETAVVNAGACVYTLTVYPTTELRRTHESSKPQVYTAIIGVVFFAMTATFFAYDRYLVKALGVGFQL
jgi:hypothetical protein